MRFLASSIVWEVSALVLLGILIFFLMAFFLKSKLAKRRKNDQGISSQFTQSPPTPTKPAPEEVIIKPEERCSELVFFTDEVERFRLEDLLEGVADLRTHGFCSSLYKVQLKNGAIYAVKRLKKLKVSFEEFGLTMRTIGNLRHPNILPLVCYNSGYEEKLLIYRFQTNGSLLDLFENYAQGKRPFPWKLRLSIAVGIARALAFVHLSPDDGGNEAIPHGNIKPSNIILNDDLEPMISEYGYTKFVDYPACLSMQGYTPPERRISSKGDVYSFGVVALELLTGKVVEKSGLDLPGWVRSSVKEEWTGEVFDAEAASVDMYAFALLNVSMKCVAHRREDRPAMPEVLQKIEEVFTAYHQNPMV